MSDTVEENTQVSEVRERVNSRAMEQPTSNSEPLRLLLGSLESNRDIEVQIRPEDLFGRHCAVVGATGGGKSWTLGRIIEETAKLNSKLILFDASGEFWQLGDGVAHVSLGVASHKREALVSVPYYHLRESDLFAIFNPSGPSQGPKFRQAIQSLKLAFLAPHLAANGTIIKAHRTKTEFEKERTRLINQIESPYNEFDIRLLPQQIQHECVDPQRGATEPLIWGGPNGLEMSHCVPLINRIQDMIQSHNLAPLFKPRDVPSLFDELPKFFKDSNSKVLRICMKHLPFEHHTREIIGNAIARHILELAREGKFVKQPLIVALDEAHQFLSKVLRQGNEHFPLDAFGLISKEGRKYACNLMLATQRPRDIPEDVLSQMGVFLIHRMTNGYDLEVVERASGGINREAMASVPALIPGQAVMVGVGVNEPLCIRVRAPKSRPDSRGPNYQQYWR